MTCSTTKFLLGVTDLLDLTESRDSWATMTFVDLDAIDVKGFLDLAESPDSQGILGVNALLDVKDLLGDKDLPDVAESLVSQEMLRVKDLLDLAVARKPGHARRQ